MNRATAAETVSIAGDGVRLAADLAGPPDGQPVVLLHGGGQTRWSWGSALQALAAAGHRVMALDMRGHGGSGWAPDGDYRFDRFIADLARATATLPSRPFLVGASLGGMVSLLAAGEAALPVAGLVLVDIAIRAEPTGVARIQAFMRANPEGFARLEDAADIVAAFLPHRPRPRDADGLKRNLKRGHDGRWRWHWDPRLLDELGQSQPDPGRFELAARRLTAPLLLMRGSRSDVLSEAASKELLALVPHAEFVSVDGAEHMIAGDRNDAFNDAMIDFVSRHSSLPPD